MVPNRGPEGAARSRGAGCRPARLALPASGLILLACALTGSLPGPAEAQPGPGSLSPGEDSGRAAAPGEVSIPRPGTLPEGRETPRPPGWTAWVLGAGGCAGAAGLAWMDRLRRNGQARIRVLEAALKECQEKEAALRATVEERESRLRQVPHRVKNHLQVLSSLVSLQSVRFDPGPSREALAATQERILAVALVYDAWHRSGDPGWVPLQKYAESLAQQLIRAHPAASGRVRIQLQLEAIRLEPDQALPCGLLLREWVSNALRHAFPGDRTGSVALRIGSPGGGRVRIEVADDGVGLPPGLDVAAPETLGLLLASDLIRQLGGVLSAGSGPGTVLAVEFTPTRPVAGPPP